MLKTNSLTGFGARKAASAAVPSTIASVAKTSTLTNTGSPSFAGLNFGTAAADRVLLAFICYDGAPGGAGFPATALIGGVTANKIAEHLTTGGRNLALYAAAVPTGTSGTVSLTLTNPGAGNIAYLINLLRATAIATTASDTDTPAVATATSISASIDSPAGGVIVSAVFDQDNNSLQTWTNLTELDELGAFSVELSSAGEVFASAQTGRSISVGPTTPATHTLRLIAASFAHSP